MTTSPRAVGTTPVRWPELPWREWEPTSSTLHMWAQIVGKLRLALARRSTTGGTSRCTSVPAGSRPRRSHAATEIPGGPRLRGPPPGRHRWRPGSFAMGLVPRSVARFFHELMAGSERGIEVRICRDPWRSWRRSRSTGTRGTTLRPVPRRTVVARTRPGRPRPEGVPDGLRRQGQSRPFLLGRLRSGRDSLLGPPGTAHPGGIPNCPGSVMVEAESHQHVTVGWWPLSEPPGPAFYAYAYPEPEGFRAASVRPERGVLRRPVRRVPASVRHHPDAADPDAAVLEFLESTYEAGADLGGWDRRALEPAELPDRPRGGREAWPDDRRSRLGRAVDRPITLEAAAGASSLCTGTSSVRTPRRRCRVSASC